MRGDGDGWVECDDGRRRWGRFGAAGLLLRAPDPTGGPEPLVLLQLRVAWSHHGGTWGLPGGARDSHESPVEGALREVWEETGIEPADVSPRASSVDDLGGDSTGWSYTTVLADAARPLATVANRESDELRWVPESEVPALPLHPGLRDSWPHQHAAVRTLVVDTANLLGAVPDGWWRDRAGSTAALLDQLAAALPRTVELPVEHVAQGVAEAADGGAVSSDGGAASADRGTVSPADPGTGATAGVGAGRAPRSRTVRRSASSAGPHGAFAWVGGAVAVVEGRAREVADPPAPARLRLVRAAGSGDDAIVAVVGELLGAGVRPVVVTADRGLRDPLPRSVPVLGPAAVRRWSDDGIAQPS